MTDFEKSFPSLYLFIIWHHAGKYEDAIMQDIRSRFDVFKTYSIDGPECHFAQNMARFYGKTLLAAKKKQKETGTGDFKVVLVYDNKPNMINGKNERIVSAKTEYRKKCHANVVHASDNPAETNENLLLLFGKTIEEITKENAGDTVVLYNHNLIGYPCWKNKEEALEIANKIPHTKIQQDKNTVHIFSLSPFLIKRILNAHKGWWPFGCKYFINIQNKKYPLYISRK
ncbi:MAG: hypothetical protein IJ846_09120 [Alphaproteobacteria bacterium]|nr:hypothetical protein [Alphaproteobacteria bacterium]